MVLAEAAAELRSQLGAYGILRESARAAAAGTGEGGALAADNLGSAFDAEAAAAIMMGDVTVDLTPEKVFLGVIPLLSMAFFVWFREHHPETSAGSSALVHALDLCPGGSFALRRGLTAFLQAYHDAGATREDFDIDLVASFGPSARLRRIMARSVAPSSTTPIEPRSGG